MNMNFYKISLMFLLFMGFRLTGSAINYDNQAEVVARTKHVRALLDALMINDLLVDLHSRININNDSPAKVGQIRQELTKYLLPPLSKVVLEYAPPRQLDIRIVTGVRKVQNLIEEYHLEEWL